MLPEINRSRSRSTIQALSWMAPLLVLSLLFILPLILFILQGIRGSGNGDLFPLKRLFLFTLFQALASAAGSLILALPGAWFLGRYDFPGRRVLKAVTTLPFVMPPILVVLGFILFWGRNGFIGQLIHPWGVIWNGPLYRVSGILMAHLFYNIPIALRFLTVMVEHLPDDQLKAASTLGAGPVRRFFTVMIPALGPALLSSAVLIFLYCFLSFSIVLILGGGPRFSTLEVEIYRLIRAGLNFKGALKLVLLESAVSLAAYLLFFHAEGRFRQALIKGARKGPQIRPERMGKIVFGIYFILLLVFLTGPLLTIPVRSLMSRPSRSSDLVLSIKGYQDLLNYRSPAGRPALKALGNSLTAAVTASVLTVLLLLPAARSSLPGIDSRHRKRNPLEFLFTLPGGISSLALGSGFLILRSHLPGGKSLSLWIIAAAHAVLAFPLSWRALRGSVDSFPGRLSPVAASLGAGPWRRFFTVELPLLKPGIITALIFSFAMSLGEMNATLLLAPSGFLTLPVAIYRLLGAYRYTEACALGTLLLLLSTTAFIVIDSLEEKTEWK